MITFKIDELTACLKNTETGDLVETEVIRIRRKSFLSKFNKKTGWYVDWSKFDEKTEIYALVLKGSVDIQGMIAIEPDNDARAVHALWACVSPENNIWANGKKKYSGVGGHLFAIAGNKSVEYGFGGFIYGEAMDREIMDYYIKEMGAKQFPFGLPPHPYRIIIEEEQMKKIMEAYEYEYAEDTL